MDKESNSDLSDGWCVLEKKTSSAGSVSSETDSIEIISEDEGGNLQIYSKSQLKNADDSTENSSLTSGSPSTAASGKSIKEFTENELSGLMKIEEGKEAKEEVGKEAKEKQFKDLTIPEMLDEIMLNTENGIGDKTTESSGNIDKTVENTVVIDKTVENTAVMDITAESTTDIDKTAENTAVMDKTVEKTAVMDKTVESATVVDKTVENATVMDKTVDSTGNIDKTAENTAVMDKTEEKAASKDKIKRLILLKIKQHKNDSINLDSVNKIKVNVDVHKSDVDMDKTINNVKTKSNDDDDDEIQQNNINEIINIFPSTSKTIKINNTTDDLLLCKMDLQNIPKTKIVPVKISRKELFDNDDENIKNCIKDVKDFTTNIGKNRKKYNKTKINKMKTIEDDADADAKFRNDLVENAFKGFLKRKRNETKKDDIEETKVEGNNDKNNGEENDDLNINNTDDEMKDLINNKKVKKNKVKNENILLKAKLRYEIKKLVENNTNDDNIDIITSESDDSNIATENDDENNDDAITKRYKKSSGRTFEIKLSDAIFRKCLKRIKDNVVTRSSAGYHLLKDNVKNVVKENIKKSKNYIKTNWMEMLLTFIVTIITYQILGMFLQSKPIKIEIISRPPPPPAAGDSSGLESSQSSGSSQSGELDENSFSKYQKLLIEWENKNIEYALLDYQLALKDRSDYLQNGNNDRNYQDLNYIKKHGIFTLPTCMSNILSYTFQDIKQNPPHEINIINNEITRSHKQEKICFDLNILIKKMETLNFKKVLKFLIYFIDDENNLHYSKLFDNYLLHQKVFINNIKHNNYPELIGFHKYFGKDNKIYNDIRFDYLVPYSYCVNMKLFHIIKNKYDIKMNNIDTLLFINKLYINNDNCLSDIMSYTKPYVYDTLYDNIYNVLLSRTLSTAITLDPSLLHDYYLQIILSNEKQLKILSKQLFKYNIIAINKFSFNNSNANQTNKKSGLFISINNEDIEKFYDYNLNQISNGHNNKVKNYLYDINTDLKYALCYPYINDKKDDTTTMDINDKIPHLVKFIQNMCINNNNNENEDIINNIYKSNDKNMFDNDDDEINNDTNKNDKIIIIENDNDKIIDLDLSFYKYNIKSNENEKNDDDDNDKIINPDLSFYNYKTKSNYNKMIDTVDDNNEDKKNINIEFKSPETPSLFIDNTDIINNDYIKSYSMNDENHEDIINDNDKMKKCARNKNNDKKEDDESDKNNNNDSEEISLTWKYFEDRATLLDKYLEDTKNIKYEDYQFNEEKVTQRLNEIQSEFSEKTKQLKEQYDNVMKNIDEDNYIQFSKYTIEDIVKENDGIEPKVNIYDILNKDHIIIDDLRPEKENYYDGNNNDDKNENENNDEERIVYINDDKIYRQINIDGIKKNNNKKRYYKDWSIKRSKLRAEARKRSNYPKNIDNNQDDYVF